MKAIVAERTRKGPFKDLFDFAERLDSKQFNKRQFENLAKAGAFDQLNPNRAQSFAAAEVIMRQAAAAAEERSTSQLGFFGGAGGVTLKKPPLPPVVEWPSMDRLQQEFEAIGFYLSAHPLDPYETALKRLGVVPSSRLVAHLQSGKPGRVRLAGIVGARKERTSAKGNRFAFVGMSDLTGMFEVMLFSEILAQSRPLLDSGQPLLITCDAKLEEDNVRLNGQAIDTLDNAAAASSAGLRIVLQDPRAVDALKVLFVRDGGKGGKTGKVRLVVPADRREVELTLPGFFPIGGQTRASVKAIPGVADVSDF
jgi:DNA polymerase-3 subunit alpha